MSDLARAMPSGNPGTDFFDSTGLSRLPCSLGRKAATKRSVLMLRFRRCAAQESYRAFHERILLEGEMGFGPHLLQDIDGTGIVRSLNGRHRRIHFLLNQRIG